MGSYTFTWEHSATNVYVTGTFDNWQQTVELDKVDGIFRKRVELPKTKVQYKFVVDGQWCTNDSAPGEDDGHSNYNNILLPDDIHEGPATLSSAAPGSSTAAMAAAVPEVESPQAKEPLPGAFPETPATETLSIDPLPATAGAGNPVQLKPGEKVPDPSTLTANSVQSTVKTDKASYENASALPPQLGPVVTPEAERKGGVFDLPPLSKRTIPESSLPMGSNGSAAMKDPGYTIQSAAPDSSTAALAAKVPLEPKREPKQPDATIQSAAPESTTAALAANVPLESKNSKESKGSGAAIQSAAPESTTAALAANVPLESKKEPKASGAAIQSAAPESTTAALAANVPLKPKGSKESKGSGAAIQSAAPKSTTAALAAGVPLERTVKGEKRKEDADVKAPTADAPTSEVPAMVADSQKDAHTSPEAAANPEAVAEKAAVESELLREVKKTDQSGEPAPTATATGATATGATAPGSAGLNASADKPAQSAVQQSPVDSRDISPMSKQPATAHQTHPAVTTGPQTTAAEAKTTPEPATPRKEERLSESAQSTPDGGASSTTDKKKKRRSIFGKLKDKLHM